MWLLNTRTFKLEEFYSDVPSYAILSHRWKKDEEVSFGDLEEPHPHSHRTGYKKIKDFCTEARKRHLAYVWVDTCCIDKKSSAELSEAINSMYTYYSQADICYVYLYDVASIEDFDQSSWFTRGWTLQELLAPSELHFVNHVWEPIGSRMELAPTIESSTGIPGEALQDLDLARYCVAEKLSWSARRQTTREEDHAYCLLGLFNINMPLLYGEGARAFQRLQEEIMKTSTDMSIFLWQGPAVEAFGMLASDPSCFSDTPDRVKKLARTSTTLLSLLKGWSLDNSGISIEAEIYPYLLTDEFESVFAVLLHQPYTFRSQPGFVIFLKKCDKVMGLSCYSRVTIDGIAWMSSELILKIRSLSTHKVEKFRILRRPLEDIRTYPDDTRGFVVNLVTDLVFPCATYQRPSGKLHAENGSWQKIQKTCNRSLDCSFTVNPRDATGVHGYLLLMPMDHVQIMLCLGLSLSPDFQPLCIIIPFCKGILERGLWYSRVLWGYNWISRDKEDSFDVFNTEIHMIYLCGEDQALQSHTDIGLSLDISDTSSRVGMLEASIKFDIGQFIQHYVPAAVNCSYDSIDCIPDDVRTSLQDAELRVNARRRQKGYYA